MYIGFARPQLRRLGLGCGVKNLGFRKDLERQTGRPGNDQEVEPNIQTDGVIYHRLGAVPWLPWLSHFGYTLNPGLRFRIEG